MDLHILLIATCLAVWRINTMMEIDYVHINHRFTVLQLSAQRLVEISVFRGLSDF